MFQPCCSNFAQIAFSMSSAARSLRLGVDIGTGGARDAGGPMPAGTPCADSADRSIESCGIKPAILSRLYCGYEYSKQNQSESTCFRNEKIIELPFYVEIKQTKEHFKTSIELIEFGNISHPQQKNKKDLIIILLQLFSSP